MGTNVGVGLSVEKNAYEAGKGAIENAVSDFAVTENCLVFVFATDEYDHTEVLRGIKSGINTRNIVGFTVAGIFDNQLMKKNGVVAGVIQSTEMDFVIGKAGGLAKDQYAVADDGATDDAYYHYQQALELETRLDRAWFALAEAAYELTRCQIAGTAFEHQDDVSARITFVNLIFYRSHGILLVVG